VTGLGILLVASAILSMVPISPARGSTGNPILGVTDTDSTQPTTFTGGTFYVNATAGTDRATTDGGTSGFFAIDFGTFGGAQLVTFSGTQFTLYFSQDGFSQNSSGDVRYAGPKLFNVADLTTNAGWHAVTESIGTFYIGQTVSGQEVVTGPLPINVSSAYTYVKIFDGSASAEAVGQQNVNLKPGLVLTPGSGAAGSKVTVMGGGFPTSTEVDLTYGYTLYKWGGTTAAVSGTWVTLLSTGNGTFHFTGVIPDSKQAYNPVGGVRGATSITITALGHLAPHTSFASAVFAENTRVLTGVKSMNAAGGTVDFNNKPPGPYGNDSSAVGSNLIQPISANVLGNLNIAGSNWMATSTVSFYFGTSMVGSTTTDSSGHFNSTVPVPILPSGTSQVYVTNDGVSYTFSVYVLPSLVLTPSSGSVGTKVQVQAYGFPAGQLWFVYWHEHSVGDQTWYQVAHGTTGASGTFNVTVSFNVPTAYGGTHSVVATNVNASTGTVNPPGAVEALANLQVGSSTTSTVTTTVTSTAVQTTTAVVTSVSTQPTTLTQTVSQQTTLTQQTTQTMTQVQTTTQVSTTTASESGVSTLEFGAVAAVLVVVAVLATWALTRRK